MKIECNGGLRFSTVEAAEAKAVDLSGWGPGNMYSVYDDVAPLLVRGVLQGVDAPRPVSQWMNGRCWNK